MNSVHVLSEDNEKRYKTYFSYLFVVKKKKKNMKTEYQLNSY